MADEASLDSIKRASTSHPIEDIMLRRWSPRAFAKRTVDREHLNSIFEAASWAASSYNEQPWRFLVGLQGDATYAKILESLISFNQSWAGHAPVLILSVAKKTFTSSGQANESAMHDLGAATSHISLQATALGLHTHSMAGFDKAKARSLFAIPDDYDIGIVTALGYLGDPADLPEKMRAIELAPRGRKGLGDFVLTAWGEAFPQP